MNARMVRHTHDPMVRIQVLVQRELEHTGTATAADDDRPREEEHPDAVPAFAVLGNDRLPVRHPVLVPPVDRCAVVYAEDVDVLHLEADGFELVDDPAERAGGVGTGEDVFVHEETPAIVRQSMHNRDT
jgi:hypothetical protein